MKRFGVVISIVVLTIFCVVLFPRSVHAADEVASGTCGAEGDGSNLTWMLDSDGVLTIVGTGKMDDYIYGPGEPKAPWSLYWSIIKEVEIGNQVTSIGDMAFYNCTGLMSVTVPENVISIGDMSFLDCTGLMSVTVPENVISIGDMAFYNCTGLMSVTIPENVTSIGDRAYELL